MNVPRRMTNGKVNTNEPHQQQIWITSAGPKTTFAYEKLVELLVNEVIDPDDYFICGSSYELPVYYGVLDKKFLDEQRMSSTFDMDSFSREALSLWTGSNSDSWFKASRLIKIRKLLNAERKAKSSSNPKMFYEIGVDVARTGNNDTSVMVVKVLPSQDGWTKKVVYTENLSKISFPEQAARIKELNELFNPRDIVIDANTIGAGLLDQLVIPSIGPKGQQYGALYVSNDPDTYPHPRGVEAKIYNIKANAALNNEIYSNFYIQMNSGNVLLLANERIAREKLLSTKKGQRMNLY
nr:MAG TPA: terminase large subunit [Caudoviricetes sp.]